MKKALLLLGITTMIAACGNGGGKTETMKQTAKADSIGGGVEPGYYHDDHEKVMITVDTANAWIQNYHTELRKAGQKIENVSFMINADVLRRYLSKDTDVHKLDIYLSKNSKGEMTLVYIGAKNVDTFGQQMWVDAPLPARNSNNLFVFDHGFPCPICTDRIGIHNYPGKHTEAVTK